MQTSFNEQYKQFFEKSNGFSNDVIYPHAIESFFESLNDTLTSPDSNKSSLYCVVLDFFFLKAKKTTK